MGVHVFGVVEREIQSVRLLKSTLHSGGEQWVTLPR